MGVITRALLHGQQSMMQLPNRANQLGLRAEMKVHKILSDVSAQILVGVRESGSSRFLEASIRWAEVAVAQRAVDCERET